MTTIRHSMKLSINVPVFNEADTLPVLLMRLLPLVRHRGEVIIAVGDSKGSVALATDERGFSGDECQFLKRDGFSLPMHKTGRQKTARYRLPAEADLCESCA